jgi:serine phosphatase RsbU (regulator of sigma subunit)
VPKVFVMRIRTQLVLAFLLLSVVPLTGIVTYSYLSSIHAVRAAWEAESRAITAEMDDRMRMIRSDVDASVQQLAVAALADRSGENDYVRSVVRGMGRTAPLLDGVTFVPAPPSPPAPAAVQTADAPPSRASRPSRTPVIEVGDLVRLGKLDEIEIPEIPEVRVEIPQLAGFNDQIRRALDEAKQASVAAARANQAAARETTSRGRRERAAPPAGGDGAEPSGPGATAFVVRSVDQSELAAMEEHLAQMSEALRAAAVERTKAIQVERKKIERGRAAAATRAAADESPETPPVSETPAAPAVAAVAPVPPAPPVAATPAALAPAAPAAVHFSRAGGSNAWHELHYPVVAHGEIVGSLRADVSPEKVFSRVLSRTRLREGEIAFAVDEEGKVYTADPAEKAKLSAIAPDPVRFRTGKKSDLHRLGNRWIVATSADEASGMTFGIARPIEEPLAEVKDAAVRNFGYGLALIGLALIGIVPLANHMTRDVALVTAGAARIAHGELDASVPVRSRNEIGQLAVAFNRMAGDLRIHQEQLLEQERLRKEQEIRARLLTADYDRKSRELEEARQFQLSLLPRALPEHPRYEVAVHMETAAEVGGDYYDFHTGDEGTLTIAIGDATGHGAKAGTMVTAIKSLFSAYSPDSTPGRFLDVAASAIRRMDLGRMAMGLLLVRLEPDGRARIAAAGMPPPLVYRGATGAVEEIDVRGMPLGTLSSEYHESEIALGAGDILVLMSDGFPELLDGRGEPLGYGSAVAELSAAAALEPAEAISRLRAAAASWNGGGAPNDDMTFVAIRCRS